ncbi:hypothetical protein CR513_21612, partial [Mucuna pruriens]
MVLVDKLKSNHKLSVYGIIDELGSHILLIITEGECSKQYTIFWSYRAELRKVSLENTCKLELDKPRIDVIPRFKRYYICLYECKKAFTFACKLFIGPLLLLKLEIKDNYTWFMTLLLEDIEGLFPTFQEMLGGSEHRFCLRHLYNKFNKKFRGGTIIRYLMMGETKATYSKACDKRWIN